MSKLVQSQLSKDIPMIDIIYNICVRLVQVQGCCYKQNFLKLTRGLSVWITNLLLLFPASKGDSYMMTRDLHAVLFPRLIWKLNGWYNNSIA